jgi:hypothetical protein
MRDSENEFGASGVDRLASSALSAGEGWKVMSPSSLLCDRENLRQCWDDVEEDGLGAEGPGFHASGVCEGARSCHQGQLAERVWEYTHHYTREYGGCI